MDTCPKVVTLAVEIFAFFLIRVYSYHRSRLEGYPQNISLFLHENICCGYSLEAPQCDPSNEYPQHNVFMEK